MPAIAWSSRSLKVGASSRAGASSELGTSGRPDQSRVTGSNDLLDGRRIVQRGVAARGPPGDVQPVAQSLAAEQQHGGAAGSGERCPPRWWLPRSAGKPAQQAVSFQERHRLLRRIERPARARGRSARAAYSAPWGPSTAGGAPGQADAQQLRRLALAQRERQEFLQELGEQFEQVGRGRRSVRSSSNCAAARSPGRRPRRRRCAAGGSARSGPHAAVRGRRRIPARRRATARSARGS